MNIKNIIETMRETIEEDKIEVTEDVIEEMFENITDYDRMFYEKETYEDIEAEVKKEFGF